MTERREKASTDEQMRIETARREEGSSMKNRQGKARKGEENENKTRQGENNRREAERDG